MGTALLDEFRIEIADNKETPVFSDEELSHFLAKSSNDFLKAKILLIDRLLADNYKLHSWSAAGKSANPAQATQTLLSWREQLRKEDKDKRRAFSSHAGGAEQWN